MLMPKKPSISEALPPEKEPRAAKHMMASCLWFALLLLGVCSRLAAADNAVPQISPDELEHLLATIKPQKVESPWREIPWLTNVTEARRKAIAEDKPLVIFTAADGSPLSRT